MDFGNGLKRLEVKSALYFLVLRPVPSQWVHWHTSFGYQSRWLKCEIFVDWWINRIKNKIEKVLKLFFQHPLYCYKPRLFLPTLTPWMQVTEHEECQKGLWRYLKMRSMEWMSVFFIEEFFWFLYGTINGWLCQVSRSNHRCHLILEKIMACFGFIQTLGLFRVLICQNFIMWVEYVE